MMMNNQAAERLQTDLTSDDEGFEEEVTFRLMPFQSDDLEKDFQENFNKDQFFWDILQCAGVVMIGSIHLASGGYIRATELAPGVASLPNLAALYASVGIAIVIAGLALFCHKAYVKWRMLIILCYRALLAHTTVLLFYASSAKMEQPLHWIEAIFKIAIFKSRATVPIFQCMSFQVPINAWFLMTQSTMLAYFLAHNELECRDMAIQPSLRRGVEEFLGFWREVSTDGGADLCSAWCLKHMGMLSPCRTACSAVVQMFWRVVGRPSIQMCVSYRSVVEIVFGFAMPLSYVYIHQVTARRRYAKQRQLREAAVPFFHARSFKLLFLDAVLIFGSVVGQLIEQPVQLLG